MARQRLLPVDPDRRKQRVDHIAIIHVLDQALCGRPVLKVLPTFSRRSDGVSSSASIE